MSANLTMGFSRGNERRRASPEAVDAMSIGPQQRCDEPLYFNSSGRQLFGWLHWPARASRGAIGASLTAVIRSARTSGGDDDFAMRAPRDAREEIGRASCRERVFAVV